MVTMAFSLFTAVVSHPDSCHLDDINESPYGTTVTYGYEIWTLEDLFNISMDLDGQYTLMTDIDASATFEPSSDFWYGGRGWMPIDSFRGKLDGNGKNIDGLFINRSGLSYVGLFGYFGPDAVVENINLLNFNVTGYESVGALAGYNHQGRISNCTAHGDVAGNNYVGGLVGYNMGGSINNCEVNVNVAGDYSLGGLTGFSYSGQITDCIAFGNVDATNGMVGGLMGQNDHSTVDNCESHGDVTGYYAVGGLIGSNHGFSSFNQATGDVSGREMVGGLVGYNGYGIIAGSHAMGNINGDLMVGGLIGSNSGSVEYCYAHGNVTGNESVGGLIGKNDFSGCIIDSYSIGMVMGDIRGGGLVGFNLGISSNSFWDKETSGMLTSPAGIGKTTAEMKEGSTFIEAGWNFEVLWQMTDGETYPFHREQIIIPIGENVADDSDYVSIGMITISALIILVTLIRRARRRR